MNVVEYLASCPGININAQVGGYPTSLFNFLGKLEHFYFSIVVGKLAYCVEGRGLLATTLQVAVLQCTLFCFASGCYFRDVVFVVIWCAIRIATML